MKALIKKFFGKEEGEIAVEWAVLTGLIALAIVTAVTLLGTQLAALFTGIANWITNTLIPAI